MRETIRSSTSFSVTVIEARNAANVEANIIESDLPSYTIASGLPTYEEALEQLKKVNMKKKIDTNDWTPHTPPTPQMATLSAVHLFAFIDDKGNRKITS